ncbi:hypothetical protein EDB83DRAFT_2517415 [Lactarius deliciosus]|nr:hypothetical protein EDB83DRAFT_2517415 [Lactarius deliciosus]
MVRSSLNGIYIDSNSMESSDPVRDLNNFLQGQPNGNLTALLQFRSEQTGPNNQATHQVTYTFRGVVVGTGIGTTINLAKRAAAIQALQYFRTQGIPE